MALVRVTELIFAMPRIRIGANYFYFMNTFTRIPGAAAEPVTRPDGLRWRFDALNIFRKGGSEGSAVRLSTRKLPLRGLLHDLGLVPTRAGEKCCACPYYLALKAESLYLVDRVSEALEPIMEAEAWVERSGEYWWFAELRRFRGVI